MATIHPTAVIEPGAQLGADCEIGAFCWIGPNVKLGDGCRLHSHVVIDGHTTIGAQAEVYSFACLGKRTQDLKYKPGDVSFVEVGARTVLREYVTINAATAANGSTVVGDDCLIQSYCHIAHECILGNRVIMSSGAMFAGHVEVADRAVIGGCSGVVQFVKIGTGAMLGGYSKLVQDVLPWCIADGQPAETRVINKIGMERNGKSSEEIRIVSNAFKTIFRSGKALDAAVAELREAYPESVEVGEMLTFIAASNRGLARGR